MSATRETIARAAVRHPSGKVYSLPPPARHHDVLATIDHRNGRLTCQQGFETSKGRFVSRTEAMLIARLEGQLVPDMPEWGDELYSENLW